MSRDHSSTPEDSPGLGLPRTLTLFDSVCIIVGTIIGAGIFKMPAVVAGLLPNVTLVVLAWTLGGLIALIGALCFAELTTTYPDHGGDYGYLKRAYHRRVGFAFSWAAFWIVRPGNIATMAMIFGEFAVQVLPGNSTVLYAIVSVILISLTNLLGVRFGKSTQNTLTVAKVIGILLVVMSAFLLWPNESDDTSHGQEPNITTAESASPLDDEPKQDAQSIASAWSAFWLAMVFVMFTYGGWNDIAFVAREVQQPGKNLLRSLVLGTLCVLAIYLMVNFGLIYSLGFEQMQSLGAKFQNPTLHLVQQRLGDIGQQFFAVLVSISCLGAINAMVFTSPRIYWATAQDYPQLRWLSGSHAAGGWWKALVLQMLVTVAFILVFNSDGGIERVTAATAPYFWLFLALTVVSVIISRMKFRNQFHGYRAPFYPVSPILFACACGFMTYQAWTFMISQNLLLSTALIGVWLGLGVGLSFTMSRKQRDSSRLSEKH